jgi:hypothetical protein
MGAWGTALFSDDTACDVRDSYVDLVGDGLTGSEATKALLREWTASLHDPDDSQFFGWRWPPLSGDVVGWNLTSCNKH